jgi:hypothetical protein
MPNNPIFWSSVGFWLLIIGLAGDFIVLFISSGTTEKRLAAVFTVLIAIGVSIEHIADSRRFGARTLSSQQQADIEVALKPLSLMPDPKGVPERADVVVFPISTEAVKLSNQIVASLKAATWNADLGQENGSFFGVAVSGVVVFVRGIDSQKGVTCATKLVEQLNAHGISAQFAGATPKWQSCTGANMADRLKTDPVCSMLLVLVGDHP